MSCRVWPLESPEHHLAGVWCVVFAVPHIYWAVGGDVGLAESAGVDLAARRPLLFVWLGLWGVAVLLLLGAAFTEALARGWPGGRLGRLAVLLAALIGAVLLARGIVVEIVLLLDVAGIASSVGAAQTHWSLALWNPWFVLGGLAFLMIGRRHCRLRRAHGRRTDQPRPGCT